MGSQLPALHGRRILKALKQLGVVEAPRRPGASTRGKGSHTYVVGPNGDRSTVMDREHAPSELKTVLRQLHITPDVFLKALD